MQWVTGGWRISWEESFLLVNVSPFLGSVVLQILPLRWNVTVTAGKYQWHQRNRYQNHSDVQLRVQHDPMTFSDAESEHENTWAQIGALVTFTQLPLKKWTFRSFLLCTFYHNVSLLLFEFKFLDTQWMKYKFKQKLTKPAVSFINVQNCQYSCQKIQLCKCNISESELLYCRCARKQQIGKIATLTAGQTHEHKYM